MAVARRRHTATTSVDEGEPFLSARWRIGRLAMMFVAAEVLFLPLSVWNAWFDPDPFGWYSVFATVPNVAAALLVLLALRERLSDEALARIALIWAVGTAWMLEISSTHGLGEGGRTAPWSAVWILLFPIAISAPPRETSIAVGLAALGGPLAILWWEFCGIPMPPPAHLFGYLGAIFLLALFAVGPVMVFWQQQRRIEQEHVRAERMGSYELERRIGVGGGGEVWVAKHSMLARRAAIKLISASRLPEDLARRAYTLAAFHREAEITATLQCPHTVTVFDFGLSPGGPLYIAMELVDGIDLKRLSSEFGALPAARVAFLLSQICESLDEAHGLGLVHADVKPANIMVCKRGGKADFVKVLDFGLAHEHGDLSDDDKAFIRGTPAFMAPEVARGERPEPRSDLYALGCVAWQLLTGRPLFLSPTARQLIRDHKVAEPEAPSKYAKYAVPVELDALVLLCLQKNPEHRPKTAAALRAELEAIHFPRPWTQADSDAWWAENEHELRPPADVHTPGAGMLVAAEPRTMPGRVAPTWAD